MHIARMLNEMALHSIYLTEHVKTAGIQSFIKKFHEPSRTLILLAEGDRFLLKATASNALGSAEASLELIGGEAAGDGKGDDEGNGEADGKPLPAPIPNRAPVITGFRS